MRIKTKASESTPSPKLGEHETQSGDPKPPGFVLRQESFPRTLKIEQYRDLVKKAVEEKTIDLAGKDSGQTALHRAVLKKDVDAISCLLEHGARYDLPDAKGNTALCYAALSNDHKIKKVLYSKLATDEQTKACEGIQILPPSELALFGKTSEGIGYKKAYSQKWEEGFCLSKFISSAWTYLSSDTRKPSVSAHDMSIHQQEFEKLGFLDKLFGHVIYAKYANQSYPVKINICGPAVSRLLLNLLRHKAIREGLVPVYEIGGKVEGMGDHTFCLIGGSLDKIEPSTVLCNPGKHNLLFEAEQINIYFTVTEGVHYQLYISCSNIHPDFGRFMYCRKEFAEHVAALKVAVVKEIEAKDSYVGCLDEYLLEAAKKAVIALGSQKNDFLRALISNKFLTSEQVGSVLKMISIKEAMGSISNSLKVSAFNAKPGEHKSPSINPESDTSDKASASANRT